MAVTKIEILAPGHMLKPSYPYVWAHFLVSQPMHAIKVSCVIATFTYFLSFSCLILLLFWGCWVTSDLQTLCTETWDSLAPQFLMLISGQGVPVTASFLCQDRHLQANTSFYICVFCKVMAPNVSKLCHLVHFENVHIPGHKLCRNLYFWSLGS